MADNETLVGEEVTGEDVRVYYEGKVRSAVAEVQRRLQDPSIEIAEPEFFWNIFAIGPLQGPLAAPPGQIIRVGESATVITVVFLNPFFPSPSACNMISNLGCACEIRYCTGNLCSWEPAPAFSTTRRLDLVPNQCFYVDAFTFTPGANNVGLFEMNIQASLVGCPPGARPPFAAYATAVIDFDADVFYPFPGVGPRIQFDIPIRFMVYP